MTSLFADIARLLEEENQRARNLAPLPPQARATITHRPSGRKSMNPRPAPQKAGLFLPDIGQVLDRSLANTH